MKWKRLRKEEEEKKKKVSGFQYLPRNVFLMLSFYLVVFFLSPHRPDPL
jgi:hypothetical protein